MRLFRSITIAAVRRLWRRFVDSTVAERKQVLPYVDGLRGIAILMVISYHLAQQVAAPFKVHAMAALLGAGDRGVQLFFILSAFTLFTSSEKRFRTDRRPVLSFYIRRWFRILPFWLLVNLLWAIILRPGFSTLALSVTFLFGFVRFAGYELVPGGWSLFVEETFYVFLPLIFGHIRNWRRALSFAAILGLISVIWWAYAPHVNAFTGPSNFVFFAPPAQWFAFGLGILLFYIISDARVRQHLLENPSSYLWLDAATVVAAFFLLTREYRAATLVLLLLVFTSVPAKTLFGRLARLPILRRFGRYSYSLYLLHFMFLTALVPVRTWLWHTTHLTHGPAELKLAVYIPVFCAVMLVVGFLSFNLIEKPCIDVGRSINAWLNRRRPAAATAAELTAL